MSRAALRSWTRLITVGVVLLLPPVTNSFWHLETEAQLTGRYVRLHPGPSSLTCLVGRSYCLAVRLLTSSPSTCPSPRASFHLGVQQTTRFHGCSVVEGAERTHPVSSDPDQSATFSVLISLTGDIHSRQQQHRANQRPHSLRSIRIQPFLFSCMLPTECRTRSPKRVAIGPLRHRPSGAKS
jgi:hypothetical protein